MKNNCFGKNNTFKYITRIVLLPTFIYCGLRDSNIFRLSRHSSPHVFTFLSYSSCFALSICPWISHFLHRALISCGPFLRKGFSINGLLSDDHWRMFKFEWAYRHPIAPRTFMFDDIITMAKNIYVWWYNNDGQEHLCLMTIDPFSLFHQRTPWLIDPHHCHHPIGNNVLSVWHMNPRKRKRISLIIKRCDSTTFIT